VRPWFFDMAGLCGMYAATTMTNGIADRDVWMVCVWLGRAAGWLGNVGRGVECATIAMMVRALAFREHSCHLFNTDCLAGWFKVVLVVTKSGLYD
jgi:hypothetical protein